MNKKIILETKSLSKEFKGFTAVESVDLAIQEHSIHALIGPNGAGKTTFFNLLTKYLSPSAGSIHFKGEDITSVEASAIARLGMVRSFQISAVFPKLTVLENIRISLQRKEGLGFQFWVSDKKLKKLNPKAEALAASVGIEKYVNHVTADLPYGRKRALELATTLALEPELMLLDEPTQGMGHEDVEIVTDLIQKVSKNRTILMVEHNLKVVERLADKISVLQRGALLTEGTYEEVSNDSRVKEAYLGISEDDTENCGHE